jgi:hypothetical protein
VQRRQPQTKGFEQTEGTEKELRYLRFLLKNGRDGGNRIRSCPQITQMHADGESLDEGGAATLATFYEVSVLSKEFILPSSNLTISNRGQRNSLARIGVVIFWLTPLRLGD